MPHRRGGLNEPPLVCPNLDPEIRIELAPDAAARHANVRTLDLEAHRLYEEGRHVLGLSIEPDIRRALERFGAATARDPGYAPAYAGLADATVVLTDYYVDPSDTIVSGRASARRAVELDDSLAAAQLNASWVYYLARRPDEAAAHVRRALAIDRQANVAHSSLWVAYAPIADFIRRPGVSAEHTTPLGLAALAGAAASAGNRTEAISLLERLRESNAYVCPYELATAYAALEQPDDAFRYLEQSYRERSPCLPDLKADPRFDALRQDPRFASMLERMKLESRQLQPAR